MVIKTFIDGILLKLKKARCFGGEKGTLSTNHVLERKGGTYAISVFSEYLTKYNEETGNFENVLEFPSGFVDPEKKKMSFRKYDLHKDKLALFPENSSKVLVIDMETYTTNVYEIVINTDLETEIYQLMYLEVSKANQMVQENAMITANIFINSIMGAERQTGDMRKEGKNNGKRIYQYSIHCLGGK